MCITGSFIVIRKGIETDNELYQAAQHTQHNALSDKLRMVETGSTQVVPSGQLIWLTHPAAGTPRRDHWGQLHPQQLLKQHRGATDP